MYYNDTYIIIYNNDVYVYGYVDIDVGIYKYNDVCLYEYVHIDMGIDTYIPTMHQAPSKKTSVLSCMTTLMLP